MGYSRSGVRFIPSTGYGEAVRKGSRGALRLLGGDMPLQEGKRAATTLVRWQQVRDLCAGTWARSTPEPVAPHRQAL
jgi:hypothetical protein